MCCSKISVKHQGSLTSSEHREITKHKFIGNANKKHSKQQLTFLITTLSVLSFWRRCSSGPYFLLRSYVTKHDRIVRFAYILRQDTRQKKKGNSFGTTERNNMAPGHPSYKQHLLQPSVKGIIQRTQT